ncbi:hypothetical protein Pan258_45660 [Symmachiella dynata]|nr:hypothetical protein Pan258_45660 [Symmachiella dynata]
MDVIGTCMQCRCRLHSGDTAWTLNVHHERAKVDPRPDGSQGVHIEVLDSWEILCICEDCMHRHRESWTQRQGHGPNQADDGQTSARSPDSDE